jgi:hypothetical protein
MSRQIAEDLDCVYWEDFFTGSGNPWRIKPTHKMLDGFEIIQLKNKESFSVLFDKSYLNAWKSHYQNLVDVIILSEKQNE